MMRDVPALEARGLTFAYGAGSPLLLEGWSERFEPGTMTAITGRSGAGKSTLLYLLGLMLSPRAGELWVGDQRVDTMTDYQRSKVRAELFGFIFQDAALDSTRTVLDNITEVLLYRGTSRDQARERALELLSRFDVDVPLDRRPGQVSGGQAQRIALCRALLGQPPLLLADEPTGNLDPESSRIVVDALRAHADRGGVTIVVTHTPGVAARCDREVSL